MKTNDYVKYMTQEIIKYMNTPRDERKEHKQEKMETKLPFSQRLFGVLPFGFSMMLKKRHRHRQK
ncbi:YqzE family protein [Bacillus pumilus]|uniref:YqzE family protein n=1 Tax=Bacillus pumilus TaxID=1408 RepID=A0A2A5IUA6_BACPU|nr:YqzE family protein [Bacillus pumilus]PCK20900.1 YqzE family protein [Bacillus pumilus]